MASSYKSLPNFLVDLFTDMSPFQDGWMRGPNDELLFWIPPDYRSSIWRPGNISIIGRMVTLLDFRHFTHGTDWGKCFDESRLLSFDDLKDMLQ
jgi:hypothetical protein